MSKGNTLKKQIDKAYDELAQLLAKTFEHELNRSGHSECTETVPWNKRATNERAAWRAVAEAKLVSEISGLLGYLLQEVK